MIPRPVAPLTSLAILVTRPGAQGASLCARITALGGEAIAFPALVIEPIADAKSTERYDLIVFVSANAVQHGLARIALDSNPRIAAIGPATAQALAAAKQSVALVAPPPYTSEALLTLPDLKDVAGQRISIVRGANGRDVLRDALLERGAQVDYLDVYRRVRAQPTPEQLATLEERWRHGDVNIVTLTSVDILDHLLALLSERGRDLLKRTPFVAGDRIEAAARANGLTGECIRARAADDATIVGAIARWHARARLA